MKELLDKSFYTSHLTLFQKLNLFGEIKLEANCLTWVPDEFIYRYTGFVGLSKSNHINCATISSVTASTICGNITVNQYENQNKDSANVKYMQPLKGRQELGKG